MFVYFIRSGKKGAIKIGIAQNIERRIATMQTGNPYKLNCIGAIKCKTRAEARYIEEGLHKRFRRQRLHGEWFQGNIRIKNIKEDMFDYERERVDEELDMQMLSEMPHL